MGIKPLLPSLREKKRYLVFEVISKGKVGEMAVSKAVKQKGAQFMGELEASKADIRFLPDKWNYEMQRGIIRISRKQVNCLKAALCTIDKVGNRKVIFRSIGVSGMLNKAQKKFIAS